MKSFPVGLGLGTFQGLCGCPRKKAWLRDTHWGNIRVILGLYWDNGKENGKYYVIKGHILGLHWDNV